MSAADPIHTADVTSSKPPTGLEPAHIADLNRLLSYGYSARAAIHLKAGDLDAAGSDLDTSVRHYTENAEAIRLRGQLHRIRGDEAQAKVDLSLATHLSERGGEGNAHSEGCELGYQVIGYFGYNFDPILSTFPLTPEGRRAAIEYAIAAVGDTPTRSEIQDCHDYSIDDLRVKVFEHRSLTVRRLIHTEVE